MKGLCANHNVKLITVAKAKTLGEWAGLCKIDSEGKARKVIDCFCVVVKMECPGLGNRIQKKAAYLQELEKQVQSPNSFVPKPSLISYHDSYCTMEFLIKRLQGSIYYV
ncbi:hypothetical protein L6164_025925 [Bauhinia variegata]|uniref:Uncharacterized protein n=1 Tax=Bauhinia variegata TaxID=167791 RepID=A0ACB9M3J5_BAUVA|nr:hypothetical protein L6164_025925 [Bauhinia variegata]